MKSCPICKKKKNTIRIINIKDFPIINTPIKITDKENFFKKKKIKKIYDDLKILLCKRCFHSFLEKVPNQKNMDDLYSKFYNYPSPLLGRFNPGRDTNFLNFFQNNKKVLSPTKIKDVLEIGCYDGYVLYKLKKMGFNVSGCEPSKGALIGKKFGLNIYKRFFNSKFFMKKNLKYDLVFSRHFLEHMVNPSKILEEKTKILNKDGLIIIEVPNVQYYLKKSLLEVFSLQHIHGFSLNSLKKLLKKFNFKILKVNKFSENLIIIAQKNSKKIDTIKIKNLRFNNNIKKNKILIKKKINNYVQKNKKVVFWGAGGFSVAATFLYGIKERYISYIVDNDNKKENMEFLHNSIKIFSRSKLNFDHPDLIIITSYYSEDILELIKKNKYKVDVLKIFPSPQLIRINS